MRPSRREFVKWLSAGGISVSLSHLASAANAPFAAHETLPGRGNFNPATKGAGRVDGVAKVTGAKLYASDFRANDLPGWPQTTSHAILVRANDATHVYTGMDLARLGGALKPSVVVTAADLDRIGTQVPEFYAGDLFCPVGKTPLYLGQPVALLIFEKFDAFDQARLALRDGTFVQFGEETGPVVVPDYGAFRFTRVAGPSPDKPDVYSPIQAGWVSPKKVQNAALPVWSPLAKEMSPDYAKAAKIWRADPRRACSGRRLAAGARPRVRDAIGRPDVPRAGMRARLVQRQGRQSRTAAWRAIALRGGGVDRASLGQGRARPTSRRTSTRSSPMSAAALADATTRRSSFMSRSPRSAFPGSPCGWRMTATSNFRAASSATRSRCARASASIARPARSRRSPPITCSTAAGSPISRPASPSSPARARSASTTFQRSTSGPSRCIRAA